MGYSNNGLVIIMISPAMMNFLESQQQGQQPMQGMPQDMPSLANNSAAPTYNPFDTGISKAINSARESLGMTQKQQDKALRSSMLAFANNIAGAPKQRGFFNNFASVGRALSPAISTYDQEENAALNENNALGNQILKHQAMEQDRQAQAEEQAWRRQHAEAQLDEQRKYHNLMDNFRQDQTLNRANLEQDKVKNKAWEHREKHNATKLIPEITTQYEKNQEILPTINVFKTLLSNSKLSGSSKIAGLKRYVAQQTGEDEDILNAKNLGQFYLEWMNANSKGALSDRDIKVYSAGFADIEKNPQASIKILDRLEKKLQNQQDIFTTKLNLYDEDPGANLSQINILNRNMRNKANGKYPVAANKEITPIIPENTGMDKMPMGQESVMMQNANGDKLNIDANDKQAIQDAINDGYNE